MQDIIIICGEPSGDLHAAALIKRILEKNPHLKIAGIGGCLLKEIGVKIYSDIKELSCIGFFDVLTKLPKFLALKKLILNKIKEERPKVIILVDFSGFNLRLARAIKKTAPVVYYISPQVWASRQGRIKTIKECADKIIVFFKFEQEFYNKFGVRAECVGHPLLDIVKPSMERGDFLKKFSLDPRKTTIAILPGSRNTEIKFILPVMLESASIINKGIKDIQWIIAKPTQTKYSLYENIISKYALKPVIIESLAYDCINAADFCLVASGSATLETVIMQKPFCLIYKMSLFNYLLYRPQIKIPYIGIVNIVSGKKIIPEFVQFKARAKIIAEYVLSFLSDPKEKNKIKNELFKIKQLLGETGAVERARDIIIPLLNKK